MISTGITLDDIEVDTVFTGQDFRKYKKGFMCRGFGANGKTKCYPKIGDQFQTSDKLVVWMENNTQVLL